MNSTRLNFQVPVPTHDSVVLFLIPHRVFLNLTAKLPVICSVIAVEKPDLTVELKGVVSSACWVFPLNNVCDGIHWESPTALKLALVRAIPLENEQTSHFDVMTYLAARDLFGSNGWM